MALPTLDATFASSADLPRKQMLAKWLVEELGETQAPSSVLVSGAGLSSVNGLYVLNGENSGKNKYTHNGNFIQWDGSLWTIFDNEFDDIIYTSIEDVANPWNVINWGDNIGGLEPVPVVTEVSAPSPLSNYYSLPERYLWAKIAVAAGGPKTEADYISLPTRYVWSDIYNAVAGSSGNHNDWSEKEALGHIAAAYRGDIENPANLATYIDWPWRYKVASIIGGIAPSDPYFSNVSLLLHMDGTNESTTFIDNSINNLTVTAYGDTQISTTNKAFGTGSALFDGNGDYLEITDIDPFEFGSEDFTIECWVYMVEGAGGTTIARWNGQQNAFFFYVDTQGIVIYLNDTIISEVTGGVITPDEWHHVCLVRNENDLKSFINGQQVGTTATFTNSITPSSATLRIGWDSGQNIPFNGHIDELRISKGVARYTENFTPQTASFPNQ